MSGFGLPAQENTLVLEPLSRFGTFASSPPPLRIQFPNRRTQRKRLPVCLIASPRSTRA